MSKITPRSEARACADVTDEASEPDFKPLTAEEAQQWREKNPPQSPWRVWWVQVGVGVLVALLAWAVTGEARMGWSAAYGALAVVLPSALFARALSRQKAVANAGAALVGLLVWEMVKIASTVAMLFAAPRLVSQLSWLALLAGFVAAMKVYWVALWWRPGRRASPEKNLN